MADLFVDTAGWGHLADAAQAHHERAKALYRTDCKLVTTNYVIAELVALLTSPLRVPRQAAVAFMEAIRTSPRVEMVHVTPALDEEAWRLLVQRQDKAWSLVDCTSFVVMQQRNLTEALTTDHHFEQAGFVCLLKP